MSIFGSIVSKIIGHHADASGSAPAAPHAEPAGETPASPPVDRPAAPSPSVAAAPAVSSVPSSGVDAAGVLSGLASKSSQTLDWQHSIVDMLKLLDLDSGLGARQALAKELHYTGDMHDSAAMNIWLQAQVMAKLTENGGKVPADLKV